MGGSQARGRSAPGRLSLLGRGNLGGEHETFPRCTVKKKARLTS
jgi:hypothetical protein